jgi:hypothetical protein
MRKTIVCLLALCVLWVGLVPDDAGAIPSFARRHKLSCTTCHDPFPRLKPYGEEFAGNGFYLPEDDPDRDYVSAGDDLLRLNRDFPVAARMDLWLQWEQDADVETDLQTPWGVKLLSGGPVYEDIGYYFYFYMDERGEVAGVEDAYIHFNDVFGQPLDIMVGQFQTSDPLMKRELRLTYEDYEVYKTRVGDSRTNLTYDRGVMVPFTLEATGTDLVAMVVNGNGRVEAGEDHDFDDDEYKNFGARLLQPIGEYGTVGGFGYWGKERLAGDLGTAAAPNPVTAENEVTYYGVDLSFGYDGYVTFTGQWLYREDTAPVLASPEMTDVETQGFVAEVIIAPHQDRSTHYFTLLYNNVDSDWEPDDYESYSVGATYLMARNLRLNAEYTLLATQGIVAETGIEDTSRFSLGVIGAF